MDVLLRHRAQPRQLRDRGQIRLGVAGGSGVGEADGVGEQVEEHLAPVLAVAEQAEVGEGFLGGPELALALAELVAEGDEEAAVALSLVLGEGEDAGQVVAFGTVFLFAEVAHHVAAVRGADAHDVEEEGVDVVVEGFMVEEELAQEAEVAAPGALATAVDFEEADVVVAVDFVAWWVVEGAFGAVAGEGFEAGEVREAEFVDVD